MSCVLAGSAVLTFWNRVMFNLALSPRRQMTMHLDDGLSLYTISPDEHTNAQFPHYISRKSVVIQPQAGNISIKCTFCGDCWPNSRLGFPAQQTRDIGPKLIYCWANVGDGGATVNQRWANVSCLLGEHCCNVPPPDRWHEIWGVKQTPGTNLCQQVAPPQLRYTNLMQHLHN